MKLTRNTIKRLSVKAKRYDSADDKITGLAIAVFPSGVKSWSVRYTFQGRVRRFTIGKWPTINLQKARKIATAQLQIVALSRDPQAEKIAARKPVETFGTVWERYLRQHVRRNLKTSTAKEIERLGDKIILPKFTRYELAIEPREIKALVSSLSERAPTTANRVLSIMAAFYNWARNELLISANPCEGLSKPTPEKSRDRILTDQELKWFWRACDKIGYPYGDALKVQLLTGARRSEVAGMTWDELDQVAKTWSLPGSRTKNGQPLVVHISDQFDAILDRIKSSSDFVFGVNGKPPTAYSQAKARVDKLMTKFAKEDFEQPPPEWKLHDLRRSAASGMAKLGIQLPVIERCLNHLSGSFHGIVGVYHRHGYADEMRAAFIAWSDHVAAILHNG